MAGSSRGDEAGPGTFSRAGGVIPTPWAAQAPLGDLAGRDGLVEVRWEKLILMGREKAWRYGAVPYSTLSLGMSPSLLSW